MEVRLLSGGLSASGNRQRLTELTGVPRRTRGSNGRDEPTAVGDALQEHPLAAGVRSAAHAAQVFLPFPGAGRIRGGNAIQVDQMRRSGASGEGSPDGDGACGTRGGGEDGEVLE